jgi:hypothetical protein
MGNSAVTQSLIVLLVAAFVVFRFAVRELKPRVIKGSTVWLRPGIIGALTALLIWETLAFDPPGSGQLVVALIVGAIAGAITGMLVVRYTTFSPAGIPNAVTASGSRITFAIWLIAFALRFLARFVVPHGADARTQLPMNTGTITMAAVAFVVIAIAFRAEIARLAPNAPRTV